MTTHPLMFRLVFSSHITHMKLQLDLSHACTKLYRNKLIKFSNKFKFIDEFFVIIIVVVVVIFFFFFRLVSLPPFPTLINVIKSPMFNQQKKKEKERKIFPRN